MAKKLELPEASIDDRMQTFIEHGSGTDVKDLEGTKRLVVDIPANLHRRIKLHCAAEGCKMNAFIRDAAIASLERHDTS
jgi:hypothetical protein